MVFSSRVRSIQKEKANVSEVYSLWDLLVADYQIMDQIKVYENFTHDPDLLLLMYNTLNDLEEKIKDVLKKMKTYSIKSVDAPRAYVTEFLMALNFISIRSCEIKRSHKAICSS